MTMHGARLLWLGAYLSCAPLCACAIEAAHGASPPAADAGRAERDPEPREDPCEASLVGMTRAAVKACRGRPSEQHGDEWVYTPHEGCREMIISEVVRFKDGVVVSVGIRRQRTNKICGRAPSRER